MSSRRGEIEADVSGNREPHPRDDYEGRRCRNNQHDPLRFHRSPLSLELRDRTLTLSWIEASWFREGCRQNVQVAVAVEIAVGFDHLRVAFFDVEHELKGVGIRPHFRANPSPWADSDHGGRQRPVHAELSVKADPRKLTARNLSRLQLLDESMASIRLTCFARTTAAAISSADSCFMTPA